MEAALTRLRSLTADELREEFARAGVKCGPITPTTRATFERKLARVWAGTANASAEHGDGASADISDGADQAPVGAAAPASAAASRKLTENSYEDSDFGYGVGLNPPDEEEVSAKSSESFPELSSQNATETPPKQTRVSPTLYYGVCPPWDDVLTRSGTFSFKCSLQFSVEFGSETKMSSMCSFFECHFSPNRHSDPKRDACLVRREML